MTRAEQLAHYTDTAAALSQGDRIAQLEALLHQARPYIESFACLTKLPLAAKDARTLVDQIRAVLAKAGASHV